MGKLVHVDAATVQSGMRGLNQLLADDGEWKAEQERFESHIEELRVQRNRDFEDGELTRLRRGVFDPARSPARTEVE